MRRFITVIRVPNGWAPALYYRDPRGHQHILELSSQHKSRQLAMNEALRWSQRTGIDIDFEDDICYVKSLCDSPTPTFLDNANEVRCQKCKKLWFF